MMKRQRGSKTVTGAVSRRDVLRAGSLLLPATAVVPGLFTRVSRAQIASTAFDFYISTTGNDNNSGTLVSPWSINAINTKQSTYAGKRVGIIAGTYDVSPLMNSKYHTPVLNINGGPSSATPTYIGSSDTSGNYSGRVATLDAKGASGAYGGGNANISSIIGQGAEVNVGSNWGNWTIDGLRLTGFSLWAVHFGNYDGTRGAVPNATLQNCEIFGGNAQSATVASGVNLAPIVVYTGLDCTVRNNYIHDNFGWTDNQHFSGMYVWGLGASQIGISIIYNTLVNSGNVHSKEATQYNATVAYNYVDMTNKIPSGGPDQNAAGIFGFNADGKRGTLTGIHHNIILARGVYIDTQNDTGQNGWYTPVSVYNNTFVNVGTNTAGGAGFTAYEMSAGLKPVTFYNNLYYDNGQSTGGYGYILVPKDAFALSDYNIFGSASNAYAYVAAGAQNSGGETTTSFANWKTQTGTDSHSSTNSISLFVNIGALALGYHVQLGSPAYQTGRVGGVPLGAVCNVGAWDGTVPIIGCDFAASVVLPKAPVLSVS